jgi:low temperature requirement protein LtrA
LSTNFAHIEATRRIHHDFCVGDGAGPPLGGTIASMSEPQSSIAEPSRRVTMFELFFDLVFVFAVTRVTGLVLENPTAAGMGRGLIVLALLWWAWGAYAWLTNAVDTNSTSSRAVILAAMGAMLIVAIAVPQASGINALAFALCYFAVRALHLVLFAVAGGSQNRAAILRLAPGNLAASVLLIIGVFLPPGVQIGLWVAAVVIDYGTPLVTGVGGFTVHAAHFVERHSLVVIIALGESIVSIGAGVLRLEQPRITLTITGAVLLSVAVIGGFWWAYFDREAELTERVLSMAQGARRAHYARDIFSYLHLPLVAGVVFVAVGIEGVIAHPLEGLHGVYPVCLGGGCALFLAGLGSVRRRRGHRFRLDHLVGVLVCLATIPLASRLPGMLTLAVLGVLLFVSAFIARASTKADIAVDHPPGTPTRTA